MILPLFLWITRQKGAQERRGGIGCGSGWNGVATPDRRAGQGGCRPHQPTRSPPLSSVVTVNTAPQDTGERPRKPANFSLADVASAIYGHKTPAFVGFLLYPKIPTPILTPNRVLEGQPRAARGT